MTAWNAHHKITEAKHLQEQGKAIRGDVARKGETEIKRRGKRRRAGIRGRGKESGWRWRGQSRSFVNALEELMEELVDDRGSQQRPLMWARCRREEYAQLQEESMP
jgi:hypothetical protein